MLRRNRILVLLLITFTVGVWISPAEGAPQSILRRFEFSSDSILSKWKEKIMNGKVLYSIDVEKGERFLRASSQKAASGLFMDIKFDLNEYPILRWEWDAKKFPNKTIEISKENDDYAARIYVIFDSIFFLNAKCIEYVWDKDIAEDTIFQSPNSKNIRFIVAESGQGGNGWVKEERNIYEDFVEAFGKAPSKPVGGIAIMTDSDNTESHAEALYRHIEIMEKP